MKIEGRHDMSTSAPALAFEISWRCHEYPVTICTKKKLSLKRLSNTILSKHFSVIFPKLFKYGAKQKEEACAVHRQVGYTATWRMNRTLPVPARAQLRTFFPNVWRDRQGAGQMHLFTR